MLYVNKERTERKKTIKEKIKEGQIKTIKSIDAKKVQVCSDQEKAQPEKDSHTKNRGGKLTITYLCHENIS